MTLPIEFPSDQIDPAAKDYNWHLQYMQAIYHDAIKDERFSARRKAMAENRAYAKGQQNAERYFPAIGITEKDVRENKAWKNISTDILPIAPKYREMMITRLVNELTDLQVQLIDDESIKAQKKQESKIKTYMVHREYIDNLQAGGMQVQNPIPKGVPQPGSLSEVALIVAMYLQHPVAVEMKDKLADAFKLNNWKELSREIAADLVDTGLSGTRTHMQRNTVLPRIQTVLPENLIFSQSRHNDKRDCHYAGEIISVTIQDLREMDYKQQLTEKDYYDLACRYNTSYSNESAYSLEQFYGTHRYQMYDHQRVDVLMTEWMSSDVKVYQKRKNAQGNDRIAMKNYGWYNPFKATDEYKKKYTDREVILDSEKHIYQGCWIVGTDKIFAWGLQESMEHEGDDFQVPKFSFRIYETASFIERIKVNVDNAQINWYQFQHHLSQSRPDGFLFEEGSVNNLSIKGKSGENPMSEMENFLMLTATGSGFYKKDRDDPYQGIGITPNPGGISSAAREHMQFIMQNMQMIQDFTGFNAGSDASTINPEMGKAVTEIMRQNNQTAIEFLSHGLRRLTEETARRCAFLIPENIRLNQLKNKGAGPPGQGGKSSAYMTPQDQMPEFRYRIYIEEGVDFEQKRALNKHLDIALKQQMISPDQALIVETERNIERAKHLLVMFVSKNQEKAEQAAQANQQAAQQANQQGAQAASQGKIAELQAEWDKRIEMERMSKEFELEKEKIKSAYALQIKQIEMGFKQQDREEKHQDNLEIEEYRGEVAMSKAGMR